MRIHALTALILFAFLLNACNVPIQPGEPTQAVPQATAVPTEAVPVGGFTTGTPVDVTTLPALAEIPTGLEPMPCFPDSPEPSINWGYGAFPYEALCLNHFPTAQGSPEVTVTLSDPTGRTFSESFRINQEKAINSRGLIGGYTETGDGADSLSLDLYLPASLPCGDWTVSARTDDGAVDVAPTTLPVDCSAPRLSALADPSTNPFILPDHGREGPMLTDRQTIYVVGAAYPANTAVTVAFYQDDPSAGKSEFGGGLGTAKYAVTLTTDASGSFQAPFVVGSNTQRGAYFVIAAPAITPETRLSAFEARFTIK